MQKIPTPFTEQEAQEIQERLDNKLDASHVSYRPAAQGTVAYLEGWKAFNLANEVFGFNGWSSEILNLTIDFTDVDSNGKISVGMSCMVRIHLKDGSYHDDIGYGSADNQKSKSAAYEKAKKEAVTDATKRALRMFGNRLGNCTYDKIFLRDIKTQTSRPSNSNTRPANYPNQTMNKITDPVHPHNHSLQVQVQNSPKNSKLVASTAIEYDESVFDNSLMISEEELICNENNFIYASESNVYPILPLKRK